LTHVTKDKVSSTSSDLAIDLTMKVLAFGGSAAATAAAPKILTALGGGFAEMADKVGKIGVPELFKDQTQTTTVTSLGQTRFLEQVSDSAVTQQFYLQDTTLGLSLALYYDKLFGTYIFATHAPGAGWANDTAVRNL